MVVLVPFILVVRAGLAAGDVGLNVRDDKFMANISKSGNESDAFSSVAGRLDMLDNIGNELVEDERVAGAAELAHDQLREHIQAVSGVDASLVDQARERQGSGDLKLLVLLNEFGLDEILKKEIQILIIKSNNLVKQQSFFYYKESNEEILCGSLNGGREGGDSLSGLLDSEVALGDVIADDQESGVGASQDQSVEENLAID